MEDMTQLAGLLSSAHVPEIQLTPEQTNAHDKIVEWYNNCRAGRTSTKEFRLGGYAGTGKTTLLRFVRNSLGRGYNIAFCAFTGKAADVLSRKGIPASTIHSLIYEVEDVNGTLHFYKRARLPFNLICVDEASMISTELYEDLRSYGIPLLFVGDPGQLEPVGKGNPNLMVNANFVLKEIHRQALQSPIIQLASIIRTSDDHPKMILPKLKNNEDLGVELTSKKLTGDQLHAADQIICAKNETRRQINMIMRKNLGFNNPGLELNEKLICLQNNRILGVFNGQLWYVAEILGEHATHYAVRVKGPEPDGPLVREINIWSDPFYRNIDKEEKVPKGLMYVDYGYCVTCHKSQGSEWKHVLLVDEYMPPRIWDMKRWRYTGITRAAEKLTYAL